MTIIDETGVSLFIACFYLYKFLIYIFSVWISVLCLFFYVLDYCVFCGFLEFIWFISAVEGMILSMILMLLLCVIRMALSEQIAWIHLIGLMLCNLLLREIFCTNSFIKLILLHASLKYGS